MASPDPSPLPRDAYVSLMDDTTASLSSVRELVQSLLHK
jgi:hypothetical protein